MANTALGTRHSVIDGFAFDCKDAGGRAMQEQLPRIEAPQSFCNAHFEVVWVYELIK
jgi:hypothetical protein